VSPGSSKPPISPQSNTQVIQLDPAQLKELKHTPRAQWLWLPLFCLVISLLISSGISWWTTEQTKRDNERTIASRRSLHGVNTSTDRGKWIASSPIRLGSRSQIQEPRVCEGPSRQHREQTLSRATHGDRRRRRQTHLHTVGTCSPMRERSILPFFFGWWRKRHYLVFRDDQNRWWKLYEARPTIDGANAGV
jgi:hypothetical protein